MWEISLFGGTAVTAGDTILRGAQLGGVKPRKLLEALALTPGQAVSKELLADRIWGEKPPRSYVATLESYVCVLRRSIGAPGGRASWLATTQGGYLLDADHVRVDLVDVRHALRCLSLNDTASGVRVTDAALVLDDRGLLADSAEEEWAAVVRRDFTAALVGACVLSAQRCLDENQPLVADRLAREAVRRSRPRRTGRPPGTASTTTAPAAGDPPPGRR